VRARDRAVHDVQPSAMAILRTNVLATSAASSATRRGSEVPAVLARTTGARPAPAAVPRAAQERDASVGSDFPEGCEGDGDESAERTRNVLCTVRKGRCRRRERMNEMECKPPMVTAIALAELGERLSPLRLRSPEALRAMQQSLSRDGQLVAVVCSRHAETLELVDGFKRLVGARKLGWEKP
jgi:hypothetical protein